MNSPAIIDLAIFVRMPGGVRRVTLVDQDNAAHVVDVPAGDHVKSAQVVAWALFAAETTNGRTFLKAHGMTIASSIDAPGAPTRPEVDHLEASEDGPGIWRRTYVCQVGHRLSYPATYPTRVAALTVVDRYADGAYVGSRPRFACVACLR